MAIVDYISDDDPDAAQALKEDIEARASRLRENPQLHRVERVRLADGTVHEVPVDREKGIDLRLGLDVVRMAAISA